MRLLPASLLAGVCALAFGARADAQTTHIVQLFGLSFSPAEIVVQEGDTVRWVWVASFHDVKSGKNWIADGIFDSGTPKGPPHTFEVTFDAAFLQANPMPGNVYEYMCQLHTPVMRGKVTVQSPTFHGGVLPYGTFLSAPESLALLSGAPKIGQAFTVGVRNTAITTSAPAFAAVFVSTSHYEWWPVGQVVPHLGLDGTGDGEILIDLLPPNPLVMLGPSVWTGGTSPAVPFTLVLPNDPSLVGKAVYLQGGLLESAGGTLGLTNALQVVFGE